MADTVNKTKIQLRSVSSFNGDKTPSPSTKLLLNHGKPNFTIQRSPKVQQNGEDNPLAAAQTHNYNPYKTANGNKSDTVVKSTKFSGVFNAANITVTAKQPHQETAAAENEAAKVVLRRARTTEPPLKDDENDSVPEFIRRQRRIQERLAKENVLDFENRRSGYFTHVVISPTSATANRTSFIETMSSPAVVPSLEMPVPVQEAVKREETVAEVEHEKEAHEHSVHTTNGDVASVHVEEEEEVAKAIEEVNKAVAGEDDEKVQLHPDVAAAIIATMAHVETTTTTAEEKHEEHESVVEHSSVETTVTTSVTSVEHTQEHLTTTTTVETTEKTLESSEEKNEIVHATAAVATLAYVESEPQVEHVEKAHESTEAATVVVTEEHKQNGHAEEPQQNGHSTEEIITISHTNGVSDTAGPSIPSPDPSGALGVNFEPKTVVSFSKDLSSEPNNYPDTVKVVKEGESTAPVVDAELQELAKLKFDIKADQDDVQVTPVLKTE